MAKTEAALIIFNGMVGKSNDVIKGLEYVFLFLFCFFFGGMWVAGQKSCFLDASGWTPLI